MKECYKGGKKHNFQPRYTETDNNKNIKVERCHLRDVRKVMVLNIYVHDICTWCGKIVKDEK